MWASACPPGAWRSSETAMGTYLVLLRNILIRFILLRLVDDGVFNVVLLGRRRAGLPLEGQPLVPRVPGVVASDGAMLTGPEDVVEEEQLRGSKHQGAAGDDEVQGGELRHVGED